MDLYLADASKATAKIKSEAPGKEKEAEKKGEATAAQAGQKFDKAVRGLRINRHLGTDDSLRWMMPDQSCKMRRTSPLNIKKRLEMS